MPELFRIQTESMYRIHVGIKLVEDLNLCRDLGDLQGPSVVPYQ